MSDSTDEDEGRGRCLDSRQMWMSLGSERVLGSCSLFAASRRRHSVYNFAECVVGRQQSREKTDNCLKRHDDGNETERREQNAAEK